MYVKNKGLTKFPYHKSRRGKSTMLSGFDRHLLMPSVNILRNASHQYSIPQAKRFVYTTISNNDTLYFPDQSMTLKASRQASFGFGNKTIVEKIEYSNIPFYQKSIYTPHKSMRKALCTFGSRHTNEKHSHSPGPGDYCFRTISDSISTRKFSFGQRLIPVIPSRGRFSRLDKDGILNIKATNYK